MYYKIIKTSPLVFIKVFLLALRIVHASCHVIKKTHTACVVKHELHRKMV